MGKHLRKTVRLGLSSTQPYSRVGAALESRYTCKESAIPQTADTTAESSSKNPALDKSDNTPSSSGTLPAVDKANEKTNFTSVAKKRKRNRNRKQAFKDTVVLAPFHALKQSFQNKLKDLHKKGAMDKRAKRLKIPNNSLFQYEVMEMRMGQSDAEIHDRAVNSKKKSTSAEQGPASKNTSNESKNCHSVRNGKRPAKEKRLTNGEGTSKSSPSKTEKVPGPQAPKRMRIDNDRNVAPGPNTVNDERSAAHKDIQQNLPKANAVRRKNGSNKEEDVNARRIHQSEGKSLVTNGVKGNSQRTSEFKYQTRSVTRKEVTQSVDCTESGDACQTPGKARKNYANFYPRRNSILPTECRTEGECSTPQKNLMSQLEETGAKTGNLSAMKSDVSVLFLGEVKNTREKRTQDVPILTEDTGRFVEEQDSDVDKCTCSGYDQQKTEETQTSVTEVTQMFHTLLRKPPFGSNNQRSHSETQYRENNGNQLGKEISKPEVNGSNSPTSKTREDKTASKKSDRISSWWVEEQSDHGNGDEQTELEPRVIVQEPPNESSSSDRVSDVSRKADDSGTDFSPSTYRDNLPKLLEADRLDQTSYVFGQKNSFHQVRGSCEFEFGRSRSVSNIDDRESVGNLEFEKNQ